LLAAPEDKKAGLEFRESYPYGKNEDSTWLVADLVAYLNAELTPKRIAEVDTTTSSMLLEVANSIERNVAQMILLNGKCVRAPIDVYASLTQHVESFQGIPESSSVVRLDETLYCYVRRLEFRHFAEIYPELVRVGTPRPQDIQVNAIAEEINVVGRAMFGRKLRLDQCVDLAMLDEGAIRISAEHFQAFARLNADSVGTLMSQALGHDVDERSYQKCMLHAQSLLAKVCLFDDHQSPGAVCVSLSRVVAAFCAIYFETDILAKRTNHKPYWHGQAAQGGSLLKALEAVSPENRLLDSVLLEEHSQIWRCRLDWFQAALKGQSSLHEARIAFRISLIRKVAKIARVTQARVVTRNLANLVDHVKGHCSKLVGLGDEGNWDVPVPSSGNSYTLDEVNSLISLSSTLAWAAGKGTV